MTPNWSHGYFTQHMYTAGFFRETAPSWLDFAALVQGVAPPRQREGEPFRYLDLGCGMGFHITLLASQVLRPRPRPGAATQAPLCAPP